MAETIISPGVFTRENDLSFLPQGVGAIGAAFIGPTLKGPAFVPTLIRNGFNEFIRSLPLNMVDVSCKGKFIYFKLFLISSINLPLIIL